MKIGLIRDPGSEDGDGQSLYVAQAARHLASLGHQVDVFTRREEDLVSDVVAWAPGVRIIHLKAGPPRHVPKEELLPHLPAFCGRLVDFVRLQRPRYGFMHANSWMSGLAALEVRRLLGIPFAITFHALGRARRIDRGAAALPAERLSIEDRLVSEADALLAGCPQDRDDLVTLYRADPRRIAVVPCGFDPSEFRPGSRRSARRRIGIDTRDRVLLHLGRIVPPKGIETVVRAVGELSRRRTFTRLLVVGGESDHPDPVTTPEMARLASIAREEGVEDRVVFTGRRTRETLRWYYAAADVFVTTPWYEAFGVRPLESMACGTPVIGSQVGGIQYTVLDGKTGFLVPPSDHKAVADRALRLFRNASLRRRLSRQGIARVHGTFTWKRVARTLESVYTSLAQASAEPLP
ncbi:MAG: glycosyltransferase [Candidatus Polarisedimenticolia bacterium]